MSRFADGLISFAVGLAVIAGFLVGCALFLGAVAAFFWAAQATVGRDAISWVSFGLALLLTPIAIWSLGEKWRGRE